MAENKISVSLEAREGKNPGEAIATHNRRHIVFLPRGTPPGATVRVVLEEITTKKDSAGRAMYRGVPAPVEYTERWKDNGDGTASRVTIATDWLGQTSEEGVVETRALQTHEVLEQAWTRTDRVVVWGANLASSAVLEEQVKVIPTLAERVITPGAIATEKVGEREERQGPKSLAMLRVNVWAGDFALRKLEVAYQGAWTLTADAYHGEGSYDFVRENTVWGKLPAWVQGEVHGLQPICACGRWRYNAQNPDGYAKCEKCREEERCLRCGKQARVEVIGGRLVCANCKPYEEQEQLVNRVFSVQQRQALAQQAARLLAGNAVPREAGEAILRSTLGHLVEPEWRRNDLARKHAGYAWYYYCDEGVYGSKFPAAALQILQGLPLATCNGVVELAAWLTGYQKVEDCERYEDFFFRTQVKGETATPALTEGSLQNLAVAVKLRGSEADRIEALRRYRVLVEKLGPDAEHVKAVAKILNSDEQDYAAALATMREAHELLTAADRGDVLVNYGGWFRVMGRTGQAQYWVIRPDGSERDPDEVSYRKRYTSEGEKRWRIVGPEELAISWSKGSSAAPHEFAVNKLPLGGCSPEQIATVERLEREVGERFIGARGLASHEPSPGVGKGWGLGSSVAPAAEADGPASDEDLRALLEKWGDPRRK